MVFIVIINTFFLYKIKTLNISLYFYFYQKKKNLIQSGHKNFKQSKLVQKSFIFKHF